jgi:putative metallohydrolase (TIGR04338 family)
VLHELTHHLAPDAGHGPEFAAQLLELVEELVGVEAAFLLRSSLIDSGAHLG